MTYKEPHTQKPLRPAKIALVLLLIAGLAGITVYAMNLTPDKKEVAPDNGLTVKVTDVESGYGYQILLNDRILIRQDFIPGIQGKIAFSSPEEAKRVADLVVGKLSHNQSPEVLLSELEALQITSLEDGEQ